MNLGSTEPLTEMSTRKLPGGRERPARKTDVTAICEAIVLRNVGASTSHNPMGLHCLLQGELYFSFLICGGRLLNDSVNIEL
jgi:hypothetical protein